MDLVVDQVVQFHHVDHAYGYWFFKVFAGTAVHEAGFAFQRQVRFLQQVQDVFLLGTIKDGRGDV